MTVRQSEFRVAYEEYALMTHPLEGYVKRLIRRRLSTSATVIVFGIA